MILMLSLKIDRLDASRSASSPVPMPRWIRFISNNVTLDCVLSFFAEDGVKDTKEGVEIAVALRL
jgi:hypothetical protein